MLKLVIVALLSVASCCAALLGGYLDVDSSEVKDVVRFVESSINARSNDMFSSRVSDVISVRKQQANDINDVKDFNYKIQFEFSRTGCSKMSMIALETCPLSGRVEECTALVYRSSAGKSDIKDFSCHEQLRKNEKEQKREKRLAGGISEEVENPEKYREEAIKALSKSNSLLDASEDFKVLKVRTQVVSGLMTYMTIRGQANGVLSDCDLKIWSRPWLSDDEGYQVTSDDCRPVKPLKRSLLGGRTCAGCVQDEEPVDADTVALLTKAVSASNDTKLQSTLNMEKVKFISMRTQVIAGIRYIIKLQTESMGKTQKCQVNLISAPWMNPASTIESYDCE